MIPLIHALSSAENYKFFYIHTKLKTMLTGKNQK